MPYWCQKCDYACTDIQNLKLHFGYIIFATYSVKMHVSLLYYNVSQLITDSVTTCQVLYVCVYLIFLTK